MVHYRSVCDSHYALASLVLLFVQEQNKNVCRPYLQRWSRKRRRKASAVPLIVLQVADLWRWSWRWWQFVRVLMRQMRFGFSVWLSCHRMVSNLCGLSVRCQINEGIEKVAVMAKAAQYSPFSWKIWIKNYRSRSRGNCRTHMDDVADLCSKQSRLST